MTSGSSAASSDRSSTAAAAASGFCASSASRTICAGRLAARLDREMTRLDARDVEEILDEAIHARRRAFDRLAGLARLCVTLGHVLQKLRLQRDAAERIAKIVGDDAQYVVAGADGALGQAVETRILDRQRGAPADLLRHEQVPGDVTGGRRCPDERQRPHQAPLRDERHADQRLRIDRVQRAVVLVALGDGFEKVGFHVGNQQRLVRP